MWYRRDPLFSLKRKFKLCVMITDDQLAGAVSRLTVKLIAIEKWAVTGMKIEIE